MLAKCHFHGCKKPPFDNCAVCRQNTCRGHGGRVGERFVCYRCSRS
ncbi:hypothetical protein AMEJIAPC_02449 [Caulobacter sp. NIBR1757]|nr:hypothetical protein AMEJIAPC_02449 [Caulobacter sp. NIBR1757]